MEPNDPQFDAGTATAPVEETFADLGVHPEIVAALDDVGIAQPFPIQRMAIPIALSGTDMIGQARTGTGKTLAFGIAALQRIAAPGDRGSEPDATRGQRDRSKPQALVVCPTRELASQVAKDLITASSRRPVRILTVYGGVGYEPQLDALRAGVDVVVGTPGRLLDLANRGSLDLGDVSVVVLDEADEMLDLGFLPDVEKLLAKTPEIRQTLLFSATIPSQIATLARRHLSQPVNIRAESAGENQTVPATAQFIYQAHDLDKPEVVSRILQAESRDRCMIFCRTKRSAQRLADDLVERGFAAAPIHGDLNQALREKALKKFREGGVDVLVATDVAARGIDVGGVTHVINYECPEDDKTYVHRIGRTGRAGASGVAITFVDWPDLARWKMINQTLGLSFEVPQETYSTSEHLYRDQGIAQGTKGRLVAERAPEPRDPVDRERKREERPRRRRNRRRTRNGQPVDGRSDPAESAAEGAARGHSQHGQNHNGQDPSGDSQAGKVQESDGQDGNGQRTNDTSHSRRRRRRRGRGGQAAQAPAAQSDS